MCFRHYLRTTIKSGTKIKGKLFLLLQYLSLSLKSVGCKWQSRFICPHAGHAIKGRAAAPSLHGRAMGKHAKQFGFKKPDYRLLLEKKHLPHLARERNSAAWGCRMDQLPEIRLPTRFPVFFLIIAQITICTHTRCLLIKAN